MDAPAAREADAEVLPPSAYVERVGLATGEVEDGPIEPSELLVAAHRDGHPVDVYTRAVMGWLIDRTGREELVREAMREVRRLGYGASAALAEALGLGGAERVAETLFGLRHREHYFRFKGHGLHRAELAPRLARLKEAAGEALERARGADGRLRLRVLLTGGTGFVGKEVLAQAALDPDLDEVWVLVRPGKERAADGAERAVPPAERGRRLLVHLGLEAAPGAAKLRFVGGDIILPGLGLAPSDHEALAARITHVIHCAASVAFDDPYEVSFRANVLGCRNALALSRALQERGGPFVAHLAIETSYIHGREPAPREDLFVFPRNYYNNYYELTKAFASLETERATIEGGLRVIQLCPSIVVGDARTGNNRGDLKVVNAPVNAFGRAGEAAALAGGGLAERSRAWLIARFAQVFPGDAAAELNLVPVDRVAAGILAALRRPAAVGERIHLATDDRISAARMAAIVTEELGVEVRLAEPTLHRNVELPLLVKVLGGLGQDKLAAALEKLGQVFGGYSEWGQPAHEVGSDVALLGLPARRPRTEAVFRMLCRHNRYVQRFGRVRDPDEVARRERAWAAELDALERRVGREAAALDPEAFRRELEAGFDLERFAPRPMDEAPPPVGAPRRELFSAADAAWLHMDEPTNLMQITGVLVFDRAPPLERLFEVARRGLLGYERFRMRVVDPGLGPPRWETDPAFELARHVERAAIEPGDEALRRRVGELMATPLDRARPLWHLQLLVRGGSGVDVADAADAAGGAALVVRLHHAIADGVALMRVLLDLTDPAEVAEPGAAGAAGPAESAAGSGDRRAPLAPAGGPPTAAGAGSLSQGAPAEGGLAATRRLAGRLLHLGKEVLLHPARWIDLARAPLEAAGELAHLLALPPDPSTSLKGPLGVEKRVAWSAPLAIDAIRRVKRTVGGTVNDVLMAALAGGLRRYLAARGEPPGPGVEVRAVVPVDLRQADDAPLGNRFGLVFLPLPVGLGDPRARLAELKRQMDLLKRSPEAVIAFGVLAALGAAPRAIESRAIDLFGSKATVVVTNVAGPHEPRALAGERIRDLFFWVPTSGRLGLGVSILSYAGRVRVGVAADAGLISEPAEVAAGLVEAFSELEALAPA